MLSERIPATYTDYFLKAVVRIPNNPAPIPVSVEDTGLDWTDFLNVRMFFLTLISIGIAIKATRISAKTARQASDNARESASQMKSISETNETTMLMAKAQLDRLETMMATGSQILNRVEIAVQEFSRPGLNAYLDAPTEAKGCLPLVVENIGKAPARNVQVKFIPDLPKPNLEKLNAQTSEFLTFHESPIEMTTKKFEGKTFKSWAPNQSSSSLFWAIKFERLPSKEIGQSKHFKNPDGTPAEAILTRASQDGNMLLGESGDGIPADVEVVITYEDDDRTQYSEQIMLNPNIWVSKTFPQ